MPEHLTLADLGIDDDPGTRWHPHADKAGLATRLDNLEALVAQIADQQRTLAAHEHRITELENARVERVATQLESTAMWEGIGRLHDQPSGTPEQIDPPPAEETP